MTIWFIFALMTGAAILFVLWPLSHRPQVAGEGTVDDVAFFRQQMADIDREVERGLMPAAEGEAARAEAKRRLLRAASETDTENDQKGEPALRRRRAASAIAISIIPLAALSFYGVLGHPELGDSPLAGRMAVNEPQDLSLAEAVARIEGHLARQPDDGRGWEVLAPVYLRAGRFDDAARAYGEALRLNGPSADRFANLAEAKVMAGQGVISAQARQALDKALSLEPAHAKALYYRALAMEQDGDKEGAVNQLRTLLSSAPEDAPWRMAVEERLAVLLDPVQSDAGQAIATLAPEERLQAIRGMVAQLAARINEDTSTIEDWVKLIRSYTVLGDRAEAMAALARAQARFKDDPAAMRRLDELVNTQQVNEAGAPANMSKQVMESPE